MSTEPTTLTLAEAVRRAVDVCDPGGTDADLGSFEARFEDADEPISAVAELERRLIEASDSIELDDGLPQLRMAVAIVSYLAHRRDEIDAPPERLLVLAARAEFHGDPPEPVAAWLGSRGLTLR